MRKTVRGHVIIIKSLKDELARQQGYKNFNETCSLKTCLLKQNKKNILDEDLSNITRRKKEFSLLVDIELRKQNYELSKCASYIGKRLYKLNTFPDDIEIRDDDSVINDIAILLQVYQKLLLNHMVYLDNIIIPDTFIEEYKCKNEDIFTFVETCKMSFIDKLKRLRCGTIEDYENILNPIARLGIKCEKYKLISQTVAEYLAINHKDIFDQLNKDYIIRIVNS